MPTIKHQFTEIGNKVKPDTTVSFNSGLDNDDGGEIGAQINLNGELWIGVHENNFDALPFEKDTVAVWDMYKYQDSSLCAVNKDDLIKSLEKMTEYLKSL